MRRILTAGMAALTLAGSMAMTAAPAAAEPHGGGRGGGGGWHGGGGGWHGGGGWRGEGFRGGYRHGDDDWGWGLGAGLAGFALGTALADRPYYGGYYYGPGYYGPGYYDYGYAECVGRERIWDPYIGRYVIRRFYYAC